MTIPPRPGADFGSAFAQPHPGVPAAVPPAPPAAQSLPPVPRAGRRAPWWSFAILTVVLVVIVAYLLVALGPIAPIIGAVLALLPLAGVLWAVHIIDRWEPEPKSWVAFAVAWGATVAVALALAVDLGISTLLRDESSGVREVLRTVVQAPIVEEVAKGLGLLLIFVLARRAFDGPVDGVVYGALVGAGFAFTENIQYFAIAFIEGGAGDAAATFFIRGILSPFAHVMFTAVTGYALGRAARAGAPFGKALRSWFVGLLVAVGLHALWNGSALFTDFWGLYASVQIPLFVAFVFGIVVLRREEARVTRARLDDYSRAGWFSPREVEMLATRQGRRSALVWAQQRGRRPQMQMFITAATDLAAARERGMSGRDRNAVEDEQAQLRRAVAARAAVLASR